MSFPFFSEEVAHDAIVQYVEAIRAFIESEKLLGKPKKGLHIVVLKPEAKYEGENELDEVDILCEFSVNFASWGESQYKKIARAKALLSLEHKMSSGDVPRHLLKFGDCQYIGSVYLDGIIVAISGLDGIDDYSFSCMIANRIKLSGKELFDAWKAEHPKTAVVS